MGRTQNVKEETRSAGKTTTGATRGRQKHPLGRKGVECAEIEVKRGGGRGLGRGTAWEQQNCGAAQAGGKGDKRRS